MTTKKRSTLMEANPTSPSTSDLRALFNGRVIAPDEPRYEKARTVFAGNIDRHLRQSLYSELPTRRTSLYSVERWPGG